MNLSKNLNKLNAKGCHKADTATTKTTFAQEQIQPLVREMDKTSTMPQSLIDKLFENGVSMLYHIYNSVCIVKSSCKSVYIDVCY